MNQFQPIHYPNPNPSPNPNPNPNVNETFGISQFDYSHFYIVEDGSEEDLSSQNIVSSEYVSGGYKYNEFAGASPTNVNMQVRFGYDSNLNGVEKSKEEARLKVAFKTKSELEILDDGFKWRKYGKKMVKTSPHPRNYYKCSSGGCNVKKRVERDSEDPSYVITSYVGVHNHQSPCLVYYNETHPLMQMQPSSSHSSDHSFSS